MKAFPSEKKLYWLFRQGDKPIPNDVVEQGMDLRDYFAAKALQGLLNEAHNDYSDQAITELAYSLADAMMEARKK